MTIRCWRAVIPTAIVAVAAASILGGATHSMAGEQPGMRKAPNAIAREILSDTAPNSNVRCMNVRLAKSSKAWGAFSATYPPPRGCPSPGDFFAVVQMHRGTWRVLPVANTATCEDLEDALRTAGASPSVVKDFLKGFFTC